MFLVFLSLRDSSAYETASYKLQNLNLAPNFPSFALKQIADINLRCYSSQLLRKVWLHFVHYQSFIPKQCE
ncbi:hypothetical protein THZG08_540013 [Vibrio owensii]|uniref:Uncharacterized protein n=2 Tax=Vibrio owensii TaxID=696485 RepID=A0AAU9QD84_9VIBR|nr:hypothetical protein THZG08_540013 [Vibrio owensii]CAH1541356.1 hypothetical protein THF1D04_70071 [Vibrio owensii]CAH1585251.1 hypothetical protein THOA03_540013 [Vibrio owensii]CAH1591293.1 hypothetical protein THZB04_60175 [Vibrio owensii]